MNIIHGRFLITSVVGIFNFFVTINEMKIMNKKYFTRVIQFFNGVIQFFNGGDGQKPIREDFNKQRPVNPNTMGCNKPRPSTKSPSIDPSPTKLVKK